MMTGRALRLFDLVNYLNSGHIHCCIRFPAPLRMGSRTQVTFSTLCFWYLTRPFPLQTTGNLQQKKCSAQVFFSMSSITEEACHNSDSVHLLYFKIVHAGTQKYLSCKVNQFVGWEL